MYTNTCSADTEKGRIGTFLLFTLLRNSNPFQDFLIEKFESLECYSTLIHSLRLNSDGLLQKPHMSFPGRTRFLSPAATASETECCFLFIMRTHRVPICLQAHFTSAAGCGLAHEGGDCECSEGNMGRLRVSLYRYT